MKTGMLLPQLGASAVPRQDCLFVFCSALYFFFLQCTVYTAVHSSTDMVLQKLTVIFQHSTFSHDLRKSVKNISCSVL